MLENLLTKALRFIHAGQNERPVRIMNFRDKSLGGINLINPVVKARALLIKTMIRECKLKKIEVDDVHSLSLVYGYGEDLVRMMRQKKCSSKIIYDELMSDYLVKNNSIIPSRNEKRVRGIRWSVAW